MNFRDAGAHPTTDGRTMRSGVLFRSGRFDLLEPSDISYIAGLGIATVIDLRTDAERLGTGMAEMYQQLGRIRERHVPFVSTLRGQPPDDTASIERSWQPVELSRRYLAMTIDQGRYTLARLVELLAGPGGSPAVVHCWSGKDRTGISVAALQSVVGVTDAAIAADYAATTDWFSRQLDEHPDLQLAPTRSAYSLAPDTMLLWLEGIRAQYGSVEQMLLESGATLNSISALRDRYVE